MHRLCCLTKVRGQATQSTQGRSMDLFSHDTGRNRHDGLATMVCALATAVCAVAWAPPLRAQTASATAPTGPGTLTLCYERADIKPWRRTDDTGLNFDLIRLAAKRSRLDVQFVNLPWKRCLAQLQANEVQGVFAASFQTDRLTFGAFPGGDKPDATRRLHVDRYVLVRRKGETVGWDGQQITQLQGAVGTQLGYSVANQLRDLKVPVDDGSQTATELLKKLLAGRLGAAALGGSDAASLLAPQTALARQLEVLPLPLTEKPYFLMLSHQWLKSEPAMAERLWESIAAVRQSAEYQRLEKDALASVSP